MVKAAYVPDAGDVIYLDFDPQAGREQAKRRPALVLTGRKYNKAAGLAIVCPLTSVIKSYPFALRVAIKGRDGCVLTDHVKTWTGRFAELSFMPECQPKFWNRHKIC